MDERPASPEIDVVGHSDRSGLFRYQSEDFLRSSDRNTSAFPAANQNGANTLAANTNPKANTAETVNLRVRNMGTITVKKEPESDEDCEVSYSLSSLLQECDFEQAPRTKTRALKSPTSLAIAKSKSMEAARCVAGRSSRQTLENVISSLKSARSTETNQPKFAKKTSSFQNPVVPISMPSQIVSVAPSDQSTVSFPRSGVASSGPQIVDVRSLATGAQTVLSGTVVKRTTCKSTMSKPDTLRPLNLSVIPNIRMTAPNSSLSATAASNTPVTTAQAVASQVQASTAKKASSSGPRPLNIRFVLPATEPFNTSQFQQVLQTALAAIISQSKGVDACLLQQAIQAALTTVTKTSVPLTANQLQLAIQSSLAALSGTRLIPQVTPASLTQAPSVPVPQPGQPQPVHVQPQTAQKQPQAKAPMSPRVSSLSDSRTGDQGSSATSAVTFVSTGPQIVTNTNSPIVNGGNQLASRGSATSSAATLNLSPFNSARDALIKALQEKRVLKSPPSLSSSSLSSTSASPSVTVPDCIDEPFSDSPAPSPVLPTSEEPAQNSAGPDKSGTPTSAIMNTTSTAKSMEKTPTVTTAASTPLIILSSGTFLKPNQSPISSEKQTALIRVPLQEQASQGNFSSATPVTPTITPQTTTVNSISQTNEAVQSTAPSVPASKMSPVMVPTQLEQSSLTPTTSSNMPVAKPDRKPTAAKTKSSNSVSLCAGGCCKYCRSCHENNNVCGLPSCQKSYPSRAALRKHYYFNPTHKYPVPMEKASIACDHFLPLEIADSHRRARLRELLRRLPDDEFMDLVKPRMSKMISLFQLLEQKSLRVQSGSISAFKMFTEFERFRREVEAKLLELVLLPQGKDQAKGSKGSRKDGNKQADAKTSIAENSSQGDLTTPGADKQATKDSVASDAASTNQKLESSIGQPKTDANLSEGNSETVDTICLDSDAELSTSKTSDTGSSLANQDIPSIGSTDSGTVIVNDKKAGDSSSVEKSEESGNKSGDVVSTLSASQTVYCEESSSSKEGQGKEGDRNEDKPPNQSNSLSQSVEASGSTTSSDSKSRDDQPPEQPNQTETVTEKIFGESTPKDTTSVPMEVDDNSKVSKSQSSDAIMVEDQSETKFCSIDEELKTRKIEQVGKSEKPIDLVSEEDKEAVDANAEKVFKAPGKSVIESAHPTQEDKITEKPSDGGKQIAVMDIEEEGYISGTGSEKGQANDSIVGNRGKVENKLNGAKLNNDEKETVETREETEKSKVDPGNKVKEGQQQETTKNKAEGMCEGKTVETMDIDSGSDITAPSTSKQTPEVSMVTDSAEDDVNKDQVGKDAKKGKTFIENDSVQINEVQQRSGHKDDGTNAESRKGKVSPECGTDADSKGKESAKANSSEVVSSSDNTWDSTDATSAGSSNSMPQIGSDKPKVKRKFVTLEDLDLGDDDDDEDGMDETNVLDFSLPFAVKWGRVVNKVRSIEAKKIARKESYSEQDMRQFIYNKPKDAANAVIIADCHAHPSFFRAYVMPALLDKHIDDFGLFGKLLLSRLILPRQKYVQILRNGIGPELAKILGINIFPTFKRIQDTWMSVKNPLGLTSRLSSSKTVIAIEAVDDVEVPDDENEAVPADKAARPTNNSQIVADKAKESLKRPVLADGMVNDNTKRPRVDNTDSQKDASQNKESNKGQTENSEKSSQKDGSQPNDTNKRGKNKDQTGKSNPIQTSDKTTTPVIDLETAKGKVGPGSSTSVPEKETSLQPVLDDADRPDKDSVVLMSVDQEQDPKSSDAVTKGATTVSSVAVEKSPQTYSTASAQTTAMASCSTSQPSTSVKGTSAKTCTSSIIPAKATIYTTGAGKKGASSVPLPTTKGSPLFLVPVEKISPKLVEQYIQQGKGDGMKTRSSDKKKPKKPKQGSHVLVLIPSSNANGSPTIQTLTSAEQLKSTGDKKPLLLLPADKVPKSIASQSQTVRRKMVITMVGPSSGAATGTKASTQNVSTTSTSSTGATGHSGEPTSAVQSVKGLIMSTQEGKANTTSSKDKSDRTKPTTRSGSSASVDSSAKNLASVVNNTSALDLSAKGSSTSSTQSGSGAGLTDADKADSQGASGSKESDSRSDQEPSSDPVSDSSKESSTDKESASTKGTIEGDDSAPAASEASTSAAAPGGDVDSNQSSSSNTELDLLESSVLPSDFTLDSLLKDIDEVGSGGKANEMPPLDVSEIIRSFEDLPVESDSSTAGDSSDVNTGGDTGIVKDAPEGSNDIQMATSIRNRLSLQNEHSYAHVRRQSPRRTPASSKPASGRSTPDVPDTADEAETGTAAGHDYGLRKTSSPGGSKEDSDVDEGSPPRKRRKAPTRTSARVSPQVTFVPDKVVSGKSPQSSSAKAKGRKQ